MQVKLARKLVTNGWTIANRKQLQSLIGKEELRKLADEFKTVQGNRYEIGRDIFIGGKNFYKLINDGKNLMLKLVIAIENGITPNTDSFIVLENEKITLAYLFQKIEQFCKKTFADNSICEKSTEEILGESKTIAKLFSPKFKPSRHINEDGLYVTTIMDKKTGEPVEAFLKSVKGEEPMEETWEMYEKHKDGSYERIGWRVMGKDSKNQKLTPGWMESSEGADKYGGIGIRLHQLGVERMLQLGYKTIEIDSLSFAFPFHYKCGFRSPDKEIYLGKSASMELWREFNNISMEEWDKIVKPTYKEKDMIYANARNFEELKINVLRRDKRTDNIGETIMYLQDDFLKRWIERAKSQPILLDYAETK